MKKFIWPLFLLPLCAHASGFTFLSIVSDYLHFPEHILTFILVCFLLILAAWQYRSKLSKSKNPIIPDKGISYRNIMESFGGFIYRQCIAVLGEKDAPKYFPVIACIFLTIFISNLIGLVPGFLPPTEHMSTTFALGAFSFLLYNIKGVQSVGIINYIKHFAGPVWYMAFLILPLELVSHFVRPLSLSLRLYGNMYGDHTLLSMVNDIAPAFVPILPMMLGILVCFIQAFVFTMLSVVYISLAIAHHDHEEQAAH